ncbi:discoidin domain-containing protein [Paenibacillus glycanilyticus]|nr:discoidin domain-containing protein [Paenibacillus glycanilyticus]
MERLNKLNKKLVLLISLIFIMQAFAVPPVIHAADYTVGTDGTRSYLLAYDASQSGYLLKVLNNGTEQWVSKHGSVGVKVITQSDQLQNTIYKPYSSVQAVTDGYQGSVTISTANGSSIQITDSYSMVQGNLNVAREIKVLSAASSDKGFMTEFPIRTAAASSATDFKWFSPSAWYGNDDQTFGTYSSRIAWDGQESATGVEALSAPFITSYRMNSQLGLTLADQTPGARETIVADENVEALKYLVDSRMNLPGLGMRLASEGSVQYVEMFHTYPAYTKRRMIPDTSTGGRIWRFLPMTNGLTRLTKMQLNYKPYTDFQNAVRQTWRAAYDELAIVDMRVDPNEHKDTLYEHIDKSYGVVGGAPQYLTNADHFMPDSGFLWRNADLAWLMLAAGYEKGKQNYINHAIAVLNDQVANDRIDANQTDTDMERAKTEGFQAVLKAYQLELAHGVTHADWYSYLIGKANARLNSTDIQSLGFMVDIAKYTGNASYKTAAMNIGNAIWNIGHGDYKFYGGLFYFSASDIVDRESGYLALYGYLGLYDLTGSSTWLDRAKIAADFVETNEVIQNVKMTAEDATGTEDKNAVFGNDNLPPYGMSFIASDGLGVDIFNAVAVPEYYRLYQATSDSHYLDFAKFLERNTMLYTNLGDKVGVMDDSLHSSGLGFTNEYFFLGPSGDSGGKGRGRGHDSNLAWVPYVLLSEAQRMKDMTGSYFLTPTQRTDWNVAQFKPVTVSSTDNAIHDAASAVDGNPETRWAASSSSKPQWLVVDLGQKHNISSMKTTFEFAGLYYQYKIEYSSDNTNWTTFANRTSNTTPMATYSDAGNIKARYVKLTVTGAECTAWVAFGFSRSASGA